MYGCACERVIVYAGGRELAGRAVLGLRFFIYSECTYFYIKWTQWLLAPISYLHIHTDVYVCTYIHIRVYTKNTCEKICCFVAVEK